MSRRTVFDSPIGTNAPGVRESRRFSEQVAAKIAEFTGQPFKTAPNKFAALCGLDAMVEVIATLRVACLRAALGGVAIGSG
jgi:fumarate hydratase, class II